MVKCSDWHPLEMLDSLMIYGMVCWIFSGCPSNLKTDLHTTDAFLWFPQHCLSKSTRDGAMAVSSSRCYSQNIEIRAYKLDLDCDYLASPLASLFKNSPKHASQFIFNKGLLVFLNNKLNGTFGKQCRKRVIAGKWEGWRDKKLIMLSNCW